MKYYIYGNTYPLRAELTALGCRFNGAKKCWETCKEIEPDSHNYLRLKGICKSHDLDMVPMNLEGQRKVIQQILRENFGE